MSKSLTLDSILTPLADELHLTIHHKPEGLSIELEADGTTSALAGIYSELHSSAITILSRLDCHYLKQYSPKQLQQSFQTLKKNGVKLLIFADGISSDELPHPDSIDENFAIAISTQSAETLIDSINRYSETELAPTTTMHGVFMDVLDMGVLLTGDSGIGKSELALSLVHAGHRLIADDAVKFYRLHADELVGTCPPILQDFLEVRGLGVINIRAMFGDRAINRQKKLTLIVRVLAMEQEELRSIDRLHGINTQRNILGIEVPEVTIPVAAGRDLPVLIEAAVRNHVLRATGYNATDEFIQRQKSSFAEKRE